MHDSLSARLGHALIRTLGSAIAPRFNVIPLYEAVQLIGSGRMPPRAVCITFDDGYRSVHDLALPILQEVKLPATVFVTSGCGGGSRWNDRIIEAVQNLPAGQLDLSELGLGAYSLASLGDRQQTVGRLTEASKYLPPQARFDLIKRLELMGVGHARSHGRAGSGAAAGAAHAGRSGRRAARQLTRPRRHPPLRRALHLGPHQRRPAGAVSRRAGAGRSSSFGMT